MYLKEVAPLFERAGIKADIMSKLKAGRLWLFRNLQEQA